MEKWNTKNTPPFLFFQILFSANKAACIYRKRIKYVETYRAPIFVVMDTGNYPIGEK